MLLHELTSDQLGDPVSQYLVRLLPEWAAAWDANPVSYMNGYDLILTKVMALPWSPLSYQMTRYAEDLVRTRVTPAFDAPVKPSPPTPRATQAPKPKTEPTKAEAVVETASPPATK